MNRDISSNSSVAELMEVRAGGLAAGALCQVHQVDDVGVEEAVNRFKATTLMAWFNANKAEKAEGRHLLYQDFVQEYHFVKNAWVQPQLTLKIIHLYLLKWNVIICDIIIIKIASYLSLALKSTLNLTTCCLFVKKWALALRQADSAAKSHHRQDILRVAAS